MKLLCLSSLFLANLLLDDRFTVDEISPSQLEKEEDQDVNYEIYSKVVV